MKKTKGFFGEFKEFITKGNVLDMAVGVIIATAFGAITTTLVNNVFMPLIGYLFGGIDLAKLDITLRAAELDAAGEVVKEAVVIGIGAFLSAVINFVIVAFIVFLIVKAFNKARELAEKKKKAEEAAAEPEPEPDPEPSAEEKLLTEIRDLLTGSAALRKCGGWIQSLLRAPYAPQRGIQSDCNKRRGGGRPSPLPRLPRAFEGPGF